MKHLCLLRPKPNLTLHLPARPRPQPKRHHKIPKHRGILIHLLSPLRRQPHNLQLSLIRSARLRHLPQPQIRQLSTHPMTSRRRFLLHAPHTPLAVPDAETALLDGGAAFVR